MAKNKIINTDKFLKTSGDIPSVLTKKDKNKVNKLKESTKPNMIPYGLFLSPLIDPDNTIGSTGKMQGERIVTIPARKE